MKKILITGKTSYVGNHVKAWLERFPEAYQAEAISVRGQEWLTYDFSSYDVVFHVAGLAHADVGRVSAEQRSMYYRINTDLAVSIAEKAKREGVGQFILMSSMIIYSGCKETVISKNTIPKPLNFYGDSKWQADQKIQALQSSSFRVVVLRPPMIYGKGSKGNYPLLARLAARLPVFPIVKNQRSMLYIDNLSEFVRLMIEHEETGIFFPQNDEYTNTSQMVQMIARVKNHRIVMVPGMNGVIQLLKKVPGKLGGMAQKAFGDSIYDMKMSEYKENYRVCGLEKSIEETEKYRL